MLTSLLAQQHAWEPPRCPSQRRCCEQPCRSHTICLVCPLTSRAPHRPAGCCRIKYIGRNCRVVLVGGVLLKSEQEVDVPPGTNVTLNFNNKVCAVVGWCVCACVARRSVVDTVGTAIRVWIHSSCSCVAECLLCRLERTLRFHNRRYRHQSIHLLI